MRFLVVFALVLGFSDDTRAQEIRFEFGQRLRQFERELNRPGVVARRKQTLEPLKKVTPAFFAGQLNQAAGLLDRARLLLAEAKPTSEQLWTAALAFRPIGRLHDTTSKGLTIKVESLYPVVAERPKKVTVRLSLIGANPKSARSKSLPLGELPLTVAVPLNGLAEGDYQLRSEVLIDNKVRASCEQTVSLVNKLSDRLAALKKGIEAIKDSKRSTDKLTLPQLQSVLVDLAAGKTLETNYPASALLKQAEALLVSARSGKPYYGKDRPGQFWLQLASARSGGDAVRVAIPKAVQKGPVPVVVALHGAGGSENMFFDGYGDGAIVKQCAKRGWILLTTRSPLFAFTGGPDVAHIVDAVAKVYPIDTKKVFIVGHSMGAAQAISLAGRHPEGFLAVAALGGGGGFRSSEAVKRVRFFVGVGDEDFALGGAKSLSAALKKADIKHVVFKQYDDVEHLTVVQLALPDVFAFFDKALGGKP